MRLSEAISIVASILFTSAHSEYLGCYKNFKFLPTLVENAGLLLHNTPIMCQNYCQTESYGYAGVVAGIFCYCGNEEPSIEDKTDECLTPCAGDSSKSCGGPLRLIGVAAAIYTTGLEITTTTKITTAPTTPTTTITAAPEPCNKNSTTEVNGQAVCEKVVVFEEHFDSLTSCKWSHVIKMPRKPEYKFVIFDSHPANSYTSNGKLVIKPTMLPYNTVRYGKLFLRRCTGNVSLSECGYKAKSFSILPPVLSARLTTKTFFSFRYGKVEIIAKLPLGDWLVPELWLEPMDEGYGSGFLSGRIQIALSFGNKVLRNTNGDQMGNEYLTCGVIMGEKPSIYKAIYKKNKNGWHKDYHNFTVIWTENNIVFEVDGEESEGIITNLEPLWHIMGIQTGTYMADSKIAPFNQEFYITLGLSAGGEDFPDNIVSSKSWNNTSQKSLLQFWQNQYSWLPTWQNDAAALYIDSIKVTSL